MGYYSNITIAIGAKMSVDAAIKNNLPKLFHECDEVQYARNKSEQILATYYIFEDIKWYSNFPEVQEVFNYLDQYSNDDYAYIRIGEEYEDIEIYGNTSDYGLFLDRAISILN